MDDDSPPLTRRDFAIALLITTLVVVLAGLSETDTRDAIRRAIYCKPLTIEVSSGYGEPWLRVPVTGLNATAISRDGPVASKFVAFSREGDGEWVEVSTHTSDTGKFIFVLSPTSEQTQAYVRAEPFDGKYCRADSEVLYAGPPPIEKKSALIEQPGPVQILNDFPCDSVSLALQNGFGEPWIRVPMSGINATLNGLESPQRVRFSGHFREVGSDWTVFGVLESNLGRVMFVLPASPQTEAYVHAEIIDTACSVDSGIITGASSPPPSP